jgi:hypothetical protein
MANARRKINQGYTNGALTIGVAAGWLAGSIPVGVIVFLFFWAAAVYQKDIRFAPTNGKRNR